jgi:hypothetical protein
MLATSNESRDPQKELMKVDERSENKSYEKPGTPVGSQIKSVLVQWIIETVGTTDMI